MELQWSLIIFTTLVAWSAGLFASQCAFALKGECGKAQMPALVVSVVLLVAGGIAVFFHLQHWERIFNGFGQLASGITQELIAIVVLVVVMVVYFAMLRKGNGKVPSWTAVVGIVVSAVLVIVVGLSYVMAARPAWNSVFWVLYVLGNACAFGPFTMAALDALAGKPEGQDGEPSKLVGMLALCGSAVNAVFAIAYAAFAAAAASSFVDVGYHFDLTQPTKAFFDTTAYSPFAGENMLLTVLGALVVGAIVPVVLALVGKKQGKWQIWGLLAALCVLVGAICMRMVFFQMGASVFTLY